MSLEAIKTVTAAEKNAERVRCEAQVQAKQMVTEAENLGKQDLALAKARAEEAIASIDRDVSAKSAVAAEEIAQNTDAACQKLRQEAKSKMDEAVAIIIGRIVNG